MRREQTPMAVSVGLRIREARLAKHMSQAELAAKANLSLPLISAIEHGKSQMLLPTFVRIIEALQVSADSILRPDTPVVNMLGQNEISDLLADCDPKEMMALRNIIRELKLLMRHRRTDDI